MGARAMGEEIATRKRLEQIGARLVLCWGPYLRFFFGCLAINKKSEEAGDACDTSGVASVLSPGLGAAELLAGANPAPPCCWLTALEEEGDSKWSMDKGIQINPNNCVK